MSSGGAVEWWWTSKLVRAFCIRAIGFWLAIHAFFMLVLEGQGRAFDPVTALWLACVAGAVGYIDARWRDELLLLENLGVKRYAPAIAWAAVTLALDLLLMSLTVR